MTTETKRTWWVKLPGRDAFTMGGEPMTHAEALDTAKGIWPREEGVTVEPAMPVLHGSAKPGQG